MVRTGLACPLNASMFQPASPPRGICAFLRPSRHRPGEAGTSHSAPFRLRPCGRRCPAGAKHLHDEDLVVVFRCLPDGAIDNLTIFHKKENIEDACNREHKGLPLLVTAGILTPLLRFAPQCFQNYNTRSRVGWRYTRCSRRYWCPDGPGAGGCARGFPTP